MNREIKFRIWDKKNKTFIYEWDASHKRLAISLVGLVYHGGYDDVLPENDYVIQQYTGLKDSKGVEIYEGDILKYQSSNPKFTTCIVRWTQESEDNHPGFVISNSYSQYGEPEIIGNIFENKELLNL